MCRRAAAPEGPGGHTGTHTVTPCEPHTPSYSLQAAMAAMTDALNDKSQLIIV